MENRGCPNLGSLPGKQRLDIWPGNDALLSALGLDKAPATALRVDDFHQLVRLDCHFVVSGGLEVEENEARFKAMAVYTQHLLKDEMCQV